MQPTYKYYAKLSNKFAYIMTYIMNGVVFIPINTSIDCY